MTAAAAAAVLVLAGCGHPPRDSTLPEASPAATSSPASGAGSQPTAAAPVSMAVNVPDGAAGVKVDRLIKVTATDGTLTKIEVSGSYVDHGATKNIKINGALNAARTTWTASDRLEPNGSYTVTATGRNADGHSRTTTQTFRSEALSLDQQVYPRFVSLGSTVGVGTPVILKFDLPVRDKAAIERRLHVTSTSHQKGSWHWYSDYEVHWRPQTYWKPGTKVTAMADINSIPAGNGLYGQQNASTSFTVGDSVITKVNLRTDVARVYVNGHKARTIYVSGGKSSTPTSSGTSLITQKLTNYVMTSEMIGLPKTGPGSYALLAAYAMRITNSGQFLHSAPWNTPYFGRVNASHGCVGMSVADSAWLFARALPGSPVTVTGTDRPLDSMNGLTDWNVDFKTYAKGSAL